MRTVRYTHHTASGVSMNETFTFYRTNHVDDPGHQVTFDELVVEFMESPEHHEWAALGGMLGRVIPCVC